MAAQDLCRLDGCEGALSCLQPWSLPTPSPYLTAEEAPLRLIIKGSAEKWSVGKIEGFARNECQSMA